MMAHLDIARLRATPLNSDPYDYLVVPDFVRPEVFPAVVADYPAVPGPGSHPVTQVPIKGRFKDLLAELDGPDFRGAVEEKFSLDLSSRPTMFTVRGHCRGSRDGQIHTDSATKIITVLLYMNERWDKDGGRLRILRGATDLDDFAEEVPPHGGTLLVFRRSEKSWHGHEPFEGPRRVIQMNWVTDVSVVRREQGRHGLAHAVKKLNPFRKAS